MTEINQFGSAKPTPRANPQHCAQFESMLADALDGTLSPEAQAIFDSHQTGCVECSLMLAEARRGHAWLEMLRSPRPEPAADLIERIFAQTSGAAAPGSQSTATLSGAGISHRMTAPGPKLVLAPPASLGPLPGRVAISAEAAHGKVLRFRTRISRNLHLRNLGQVLLQPRLAMTAAMAFFSVALTLNLTGVRLTDLRAADLRPSALKRNFYQTNARVVSYYYNLRVVYELESRVRDLQRSSEPDAPAGRSDSTGSPDATPDRLSPGSGSPSPAGKSPAVPAEKQSRPKSGSGTSRREAPRPKIIFVGAAEPDFHSASPTLLTLNSQIRKNTQEGGLV